LKTIIIHKKTNKTKARANKEKLIHKISVQHKKRETNSKKTIPKNNTKNNTKINAKNYAKKLIIN
jgi:hypothetical protein